MRLKRDNGNRRVIRLAFLALFPEGWYWPHGCIWGLFLFSCGLKLSVSLLWTYRYLHYARWKCDAGYARRTFSPLPWYSISSQVCGYCLDWVTCHFWREITSRHQRYFFAAPVLPHIAVVPFWALAWVVSSAPFSPCLLWRSVHHVRNQHLQVSMPLTHSPESPTLETWEELRSLGCFPALQTEAPW